MTGVDDTKATVSQFLDQIMLAKTEKREWVETSKEIIDHYNRGGLGGAKFFVFHGVKVCEKGHLAEIVAELNQPLAVKLHGPQEGKLAFKA